MVAFEQEVWRPVEYPLYPWVRTLERFISSCRPPMMPGPVVYIASDYSGDTRSQYEVISVLYLDQQLSQSWNERRRAIRERFLSDGRRVSFKDLEDGQCRRALDPLLRAADDITGVSLTVAMRKSIKFLCADDTVLGQLPGSTNLQRVWPAKQFERMLRVIHIVALLVGGLSRPRQSIRWISDEDQIFANDQFSRDTAGVLSQMTKCYVRDPLGDLALGTTGLDDGSRLLEDIAAIPDFAAGAVAEITNTFCSMAGGRIPPGIHLPLLGQLSEKSSLLGSWLANDESNLRKVLVVFERASGEEFGVSRLRLNAHRLLENQGSPA
jgi:hypothetical protein